MTKPAPPSPKSKKPAAAAPPALSPKAIIGDRIEAAVKEYPTNKNRSSDLVPLTREFETLRRKFKTLNAAVKAYPAAMLQQDQARMEVVTSLSTMAEGWTAVQPQISGKQDSLLAVAKRSSEQRKNYELKYNNHIVQYCAEWETLVTNTVDNDLKENKKLHEGLDHYQTKVETLRKKVQAEVEKQTKKDEKKAAAAAAAADNNNTPKPPSASPVVNPRDLAPTKLAEKLERNEAKLSQAWKMYERSSGKLCNLLQEVLQQGWNDLFPLVRDYLQWEMRRASAEYDTIAELAGVSEKLTKQVETATALRAKELQEQRAAQAAAVGASHSQGDDNDSDTTGSYAEEK